MSPIEWAVVVCTIAFIAVCGGLTVAVAALWFEALNRIVVLVGAHAEIFWFIRLKMRKDLSSAMTELAAMKEAQRLRHLDDLTSFDRARAMERWASAWKRAAKAQSKRGFVDAFRAGVLAAPKDDH